VPPRTGVRFAAIEGEDLLMDLLTIEDAAKLLFVSPAHIHVLVQRGDLPVQETPEGGMRILRSVLLEYRKKLKARQKEGIDAMMDASERLGLYDDELKDVPSRRKD
jgi:hypothetical protein